MDETKEVVAGYIVVLAEDYRAANLATPERGTQAAILGWGYTRGGALGFVGDDVDHIKEAGVAVELVIVEATAELIMAWEAAGDEQIEAPMPRWYCRTGRARLAR